VRRCLFFSDRILCSKTLAQILGLVATDGIPERATDAKYAVRVEFDIVLDMVVVDFRAHKKVVPEVVTNAGAKMLHKVIAAGVVDTPSEIAASDDLRNVETGGGDADAAHQVEADLLADPRLIQRVEVGKNGTVRFVFAGIDSLAGSKRRFDVEAEPVPEARNVASEIEIGAAFFRRWLKEQCAAGGSGREKRSATDEKVQLLRRSEWN
jgi:hypothetical protein